MGHCMSATDKKRDKKNKIIISKALTNKTSDIKLQTQNPFEYMNQNTFSKPFQLIIKEMKNELELNEDHNQIITIDLNKTIKDLYNQLNINDKCDYDIKLNEGQIIPNIDKNQKIIDVLLPYINKNYNYQNTMHLTLIYKGLDIPDNIIDSYIDKNPIIGSPVFENPDYVAIITFNVKNKELKCFSSSHKNHEFTLLNKFNSFTAYCNANGYLYISGGEDEQSQDFEKSAIEFNDFFCIDLNQLISNNNNYNDNNLSDNLTTTNEKNDFNVKQLPNLLEPRTWHSMIFVPEKYIFIVGGSTKSVELYDIEKNILIKDSELNEMRNECSLCMVNNIYLYCFFGFQLHQTFNCSVEKCNLRNNIRVWEYVNFNTNNNIKFFPSFFCISYYKKDDIILLGGNDSIDEKNNSYIVTIGKEGNNSDDINEFDVLDGEKLGVFRDKLFTPIDKNYAINIPLVYGENLQLLLFNMNTGEIERKDYNDIFNME
jgi:hypothetical protein